MRRRTSKAFGSRLLLGASALCSWLFVYPLVHESGHLLPAQWFGAQVGVFVWTPLRGSPHVSLGNVSAVALPWVDAGGVLLPTLVGAAMAIGWIVWLHRLHFCFALVFIPAAMLLLGNLGLLVEAAKTSGYHHMRGLARAWLGDSGAATAVEIAPALLSVILIVGAVWRLRTKRLAPQSSESAAA